VLIELRGAGKRFGRRPGVVALRPTSLAVTAGEVCAVVGPNGAGKSTLLALALGFLRPTTGTVLLANKSRRASGFRAVALTFQCAFPARAVDRARRAPRTGRARPRDLAERARTRRSRSAAWRKSRPARSASSRGNCSAWASRRRGSHHRRWCWTSRTEGLDPLWRLRLRELIAARRAAGAAVLLASHDLAEVERLADRVVLLERGEVRGVLPARVAAGAGDYRITLLSGGEHVSDIFPDAVSEGGDSFRVAVADAHELSARVAALLERGAVLTAVRPAALEERIGPAYRGQS
jgi:ABC-2 type transport system ATP-binding protein